MEIPEKLMKFKLHIAFASAFSLISFSLVYLAPRFVDVLAYFWPLLVSTAMFLVAVVLFGRTSPPVSEDSGEKTGAVLLDFVAGQPEVVLESEGSYNSEE
ncbi:uncharacterized protein LOC132314959 [Cornus florida]|uniref:uncharacterized protein LOC132314959 n=1 Tax=Cornus florida TaxID=4283 RepID=UPI002899A9FE|nr:uncharacterized protein LOC132314959 [Cornus florida]